MPIKQTNRSRAAGFTLIEIQVVILIIGLLAAMAIPAFQKVRESSRRVEGQSLASGIRQDVQDFYEYTGRFPMNNEECGLPAPKLIQGKHVASIQVINGLIHVEFREQNGKQLKPIKISPVLHPENPTGPIRWEQN
ncbi:MAG: pilin [Opitutaceae bacterium]